MVTVPVLSAPTASSVTTTSITISNPNSTNVELYRGDDLEAYVSANSTYTVTGLSIGSTYSFKFAPAYNGSPAITSAVANLSTQKIPAPTVVSVSHSTVYSTGTYVQVMNTSGVTRNLYYGTSSPPTNLAGQISSGQQIAVDIDDGKTGYFAYSNSS